MALPLRYLTRKHRSESMSRAYGDQWDVLVPEGLPADAPPDAGEADASSDDEDGDYAAVSSSLSQRRVQSAPLQSLKNLVTLPLNFLEKGVVKPVGRQAQKLAVGVVTGVADVGRGLDNFMGNMAQGVSNMSFRDSRESCGSESGSRRGGNRLSGAVAAASRLGRAPGAAIGKRFSAGTDTSGGDVTLLNLEEALSLFKRKGDNHKVVPPAMSASMPAPRSEAPAAAAAVEAQEAGDEVGELLTAATMPTPGTVRETATLDVVSQTGTLFVNQYVIISGLGEGTYGKVKLGLNLHNEELYAIKLVSKGRTQKRAFGRLKRPAAALNATTESDSFMREVEVMKQLNHPNIVRLFEVIDDPGANKLLMVMEYVEGGALCKQDRLGQQLPPMRPDLALNYFRDCVRGLAYLHGHCLVHGDLKPDNLLLSADGRVKIADFGSSRLLATGDKIVRTIGTPAYLAPEVCAGRPYHGRDADVWALGVTLYMMLTGKAPFAAKGMGALYDCIQHSEPDWSALPPDARPLLQRMLAKDPAMRASLDEVAADAWTTNGGSLPPPNDEEVDDALEPAVPNLGPNATNVAETERERWERRWAAHRQRMAGALLAYMTEHNLVPGDWLLRAGDPADSIFLIEEGEVELWHADDLSEAGRGPDSDLEEEFPDEDEEEDEEACSPDAAAAPSVTPRLPSQHSRRWRSRVATAPAGGAAAVTVRRSGEFLVDTAWYRRVTTCSLGGGGGGKEGDGDGRWDVSIRARSAARLYEFRREDWQRAAQEQPHLQIGLQAALVRAQSEVLRTQILEKLSLAHLRDDQFQRLVRKRATSALSEPCRSSGSGSGSAMLVQSAPPGAARPSVDEEDSPFAQRQQPPTQPFARPASSPGTT